MEFNQSTLIPIIHASEYDSVAEEFLAAYYPDALNEPQKVPILDIAKNELRLDVQFIPLSEEQDIYGMTIFDDGYVEIYDTEEDLYEKRFFKRKTVLIDPEAVKKTNTGCMNNTIAHECVHWFKHRMFYRMQQLILPRQAKYCKCRIEQLPFDSEEENIMENQAVGIAPRILMPREPFIRVARKLEAEMDLDTYAAKCVLAEFFDVSKQSVAIRLEECGIL